MDSTFKVLKETDDRSEKYQAYRKEWDRRGKDLDPGLAPVHLDLELSAQCDLHCPFCQVWTHEHIRTQGFKENRNYAPGFMHPDDYLNLIEDAAQNGVQSVKLNYRGEPTLHPEIINLVRGASNAGFADIMINTNGNGGARKNPDIFAELVAEGVTSLMFSVDACSRNVYEQQRVNGDWDLLLQSVKSAVAERNANDYGDCRIRASIVRTSLNKDDVDSGRMKDFWLEKGVDWISVSECYSPAGVNHPWLASKWCPMYTDEFQCADPFRRMVITWDLKHTLPCCQSFPLSIDAGEVDWYRNEPILTAWHSPEFNKLRNAHITRTWHEVNLCLQCPLTHKPGRR